jgi:hypothetical protein
MRLWIERAALVLFIIAGGVALWLGYQVYAPPG